MNEENNQIQTLEQKNNLCLTPQSINHLEITTRWAKFLAITGFVLLALLSIGGFMSASLISKFLPNYSSPIPLNLMGFLYIFITAIYFYPLWSLLKFSLKAKNAIETNNTNDLQEALYHQKALFTYIGIITIVWLSFVALEIIIIAIGLAFAL